MENLFGIVGASAFAVCALPQVIKSFKTRSTKDISWGFIVLSIVGNIASFVYIFLCDLKMGYWQYPQFCNYSIALILILVLLTFKIKWR